ncbi:MAG: gamma-glutamyltransferase [bacterium]|nr:gamma-glutamyltransferase [bacterium]
MYHRFHKIILLIVLTGFVPIHWLIGCAYKKVTKTTEPPKFTIPFQHSTPISTSKGLAVTAHPYASAAAAEILKSGGNAAAAGITALTVLSVAEPHASGVGGGGFALYYDTKAGLVRLLDYRETAPQLVDTALYYQPSDTFRMRLQHGGSSVLTPGAPAGWQKLYRSFSNQPLSKLLMPAIQLADTGYVPSEKQKKMILEHSDALSENELLANLFIERNEELQPIPKKKLFFSALSKSYQMAAASETFEVFTDSVLGNSIVETVQKSGGALSINDLQQYQAIFKKPLIFTYRGYEIYTLPMPSAGGTAVAVALKILEKYPLKDFGWQSPKHLHIVAEAIRQGMTDGFAWSGDPAFVPTYTDSILSEKYIQKATILLPMDSVRMRAVPYDTSTSHGNTTHLVIADSAGNLLSLTQSINYFFGAKVYDPNSGILLNNHAADFDWRSSNRRNSIAPLRKPSSWMAPVIILKDKKPYLIAGSPGGPRIPAVMVQLITAMVDFELPLNQAIDAPRFFPNGKRFEYEPRISETTLDELRKLGWELKPREQADPYFGGAQAIQFLPDGTKIGVGDTRRDGKPVAAE